MIAVVLSVYSNVAVNDIWLLQYLNFSAELLLSVYTSLSVK